MRAGRVIQAVDLHAAGEPGRVIVGGVLDVPGDSMFRKMQHLHRHADELRKMMLREPRGYPAANCNLVLPPTREEADAGFVIMEQTEYPPMSGTNTMCVVTALLETGMLPAREPTTELTLETPAGLIEVEARVEDGKVTRVTFENVPAFAVHLDAVVEVPTVGEVRVDVAWGGMFYAIAEAARFGLTIAPEHGRKLAQFGAMVKQAAREQLEAVHPENPEIRQASIGQLTGPWDRETRTASNAVSVATGEVDWERPETWTGALDRSPCGTGTSARMAQWAAQGRLAPGDEFVHESIIGSLFHCRVERAAKVGGRNAIVPSIEGWARATGINTIFVDEDDPFAHGFQVT